VRKVTLPVFIASRAFRGVFCLARVPRKIADAVLPFLPGFKPAKESHHVRSLPGNGIGAKHFSNTSTMAPAVGDVVDETLSDQTLEDST
jgi:hypothetical protein